MNTFELITPTLFGIESITASEIRNLGYEVTNVSDGRVTFLGDYNAVCRANINLRTAERVFIKVAQFKAETFDELFDNTKNIDWTKWLSKTSHFPVKGFSLKSKLFSLSDCQAIIKKSIVTSLMKSFNTEYLTERGTEYQIEFSIIKDVVTLMIDTTGPSLHKRGYRIKHNAAPISETLAAAISILSHFNYNTILADPFCGSGTFPIECALIAKNIAPGINRKFPSMEFEQIPKKLWDDAFSEARKNIRTTNLKIYASDIDRETVELTMENARNAGVSDIITAVQSPVSEFTSKQKGGTIVCNPPYGERLLEKSLCERIYMQLGKVYQNLDGWNLFALSPLETFETNFGQKATKRRKLYNGMIKCQLYQYIQKNGR